MQRPFDKMWLEKKTVKLHNNNLPPSVALFGDTGAECMGDSIPLQ